MTAQVYIEFQGLERMFGTVAALGPAAAKDLYVNVLAAQAKVVRRKARTINYAFTDRTRRLRKSIRVRRRPAVYYGRRYNLRPGFLVRRVVVAQDSRT